MELLEHIFLHTAEDSVRMLPFLFAAFLLLEGLEHYSSAWIRRTLTKIEKAGPVVGALFGCIPQCGFSVMAANLYSGGVISMGTLLSVFLATSDEAVLILIGHPGNGGAIASLLAVKIIIAIAAGYLADLFFARFISTKKEIEDLCHHCGCHDHQHTDGTAEHPEIIVPEGYSFQLFSDLTGRRRGLSIIRTLFFSFIFRAGKE